MLRASSAPSVLEALLRRERALTVASLVLIVSACWVWIIAASLDMYGAMDGLSAWMMRVSWTPAYAAAIFAMWLVMMMGMMLPSATPTLLLYGRVCRSDSKGASATTRVQLFMAGYLLAWGGFSALATFLQWQLQQAALLSPMMTLRGDALAAAALALAGAYQLTAYKQRCLRQCRSPAGYIAAHWRAGLSGALRMGLHHGLYCLGCCWALMLLLFAGGVMSLMWIVGLSMLVLIEKLAPRGDLIARGVGVLLLMASLGLGLRV